MKGYFLTSPKFKTKSRDFHALTEASLPDVLCENQYSVSVIIDSTDSYIYPVINNNLDHLIDMSASAFSIIHFYWTHK